MAMIEPEVLKFIEELRLPRRGKGCGTAARAYLGDDGCGSWDLPDGHVWVAAVMQGGQAERIVGVFSDLRAAVRFADSMNRAGRDEGIDVESQADGTVVLDWEELNPQYDGEGR